MKHEALSALIGGTKPLDNTKSYFKWTEGIWLLTDFCQKRKKLYPD